MFFKLKKGGAEKKGRGNHSRARHPHADPEILSHRRDELPAVCTHTAGPVVGG